MAKEKRTDAERDRKPLVHVFIPAAKVKRGSAKIYGSHEELQADARRFAGFGNGWEPPEARSERERELKTPEQARALEHLAQLRLELERLQSSAKRASAFLATATASTGAVAFLSDWLKAFVAFPIPDLSEHGELARIVRYWDGLAGEPERRFTDRVLAVVAIRAGYFPRTRTPIEKLSVAKIVKLATNAVREVRKGQ